MRFSSLEGRRAELHGGWWILFYFWKIYTPENHITSNLILTILARFSSWAICIKLLPYMCVAAEIKFILVEQRSVTQWPMNHQYDGQIWKYLQIWQHLSICSTQLGFDRLWRAAVDDAFM